MLQLVAEEIAGVVVVAVYEESGRLVARSVVASDVEVRMRALLLLVAVVGVAGCYGPVRLVRWQPDKGVAAFSVPVTDRYPSPSPAQGRQFEQMATEKCGEKYSVVEEGTDISTSPYFSMAGAYAAAGETSSMTYYWIVKCEAGATEAITSSVPADDAGPAP